MKARQESTKLHAYNTILQLARKHKGESLCQMAEDLYKQAVIIARAASDLPPAILMEAFYELASYYSFQGKDKQAQPLWEEIKARGEAYLKADDQIYIQTIFALALLNEKQGNIEESETLYKDLLKKQEAELGDESLAICPTLERLAVFYCGQKMYSPAEAIYLRILVIKEFHLGTCSVEINYTVDALVDVFQKLGKWRLAEYMLNRQRAILMALHGEESLCVASCVLRLAQLQEAHTRQLDRAIENLSFVLETYTKRFGEQAGPVVLLQKKLEHMLFARLENQAITDSTITSDQPITIDLGSKQKAANNSQENSEQDGPDNPVSTSQSLISV